MKKYVIILFAFCSTLFTSCGDFNSVTFTKVENIKIIKLSQEGVETEITVHIKNPNHIGFTIYKSDLDLSINGSEIGKAVLQNKIKIKSNSEEAYLFKIKSDFSKLNIMQAPKVMGMMNYRSLKVSIKGDLRVGKFFFKRKYPIDITQNVPLERK